ncbi:MAG: dienelactone hydrolase family protein [Candidatus Sumerlaeia bacterium]|nr:dienelactone hydrolase family protein [Candidatus Sumerlaeia bacterium]
MNRLSFHFLCSICWFPLALALTVANAEECGTFTATALPRIGPDDSGIKDLLALYATPAGEIAYRMETLTTSGPVFEVSFPSPLTTPHPENNTVWCRYFGVAAPGRHPAVIMLHHAEGATLLEDFVARKLAADGLPTLLVQFPYYGKRRPADKALADSLKQTNLEALLTVLRQGILDVHRAKDWLRSRPEVDPNRIGMLGISLGAIAAATIAGVDPDFHRVALLLGGGDIAGILSSDLPGMQRTRQQFIRLAPSLEDLRNKLRPVEPLAFAHRVPRGTVLMVNARRDDHIPVSCTERLWKALGEPPILWYDTTHVGTAVHLFDIANRVSAFLGGQPAAPPLPTSAETPNGRKE